MFSLCGLRSLASGLALAAFVLFNGSISVNRASSLPDSVEEPALAWALLQNSLLYRERAAEHEEILKHKWIESQKAGHDIGLEQAQVDWRLKHGSRWRRWRRQTLSQHLSEPVLRMPQSRPAPSR